MPAMGWYSADDHVHIARKKKNNRDILTFMQANDLHLTNLLQMGNLHRTYFDQFKFGTQGYFSRGIIPWPPARRPPHAESRPCDFA